MQIKTGFLLRPVAVLLALLVAACAEVQPYPREQAACFERLQRDAAQLAPGFAALGYQVTVRLQLDEEMRGGRGFRKTDDVLGDASPGGQIRLRPSRVCASSAVGRAVVAHEMAHVALQHKGVPRKGLVLEWEGLPQQEQEADVLGLKVLRRTGGPALAERFLECRVQDCGAAGGGFGSPATLRRPAQ